MGALDNAISTDSHQHQIGVAIGGTLLPDDGSSCEALLHNADVAMYRAKARAGSALEFFDASIGETRHAREAG